MSQVPHFTSIPEPLLEIIQNKTPPRLESIHAVYTNRDLNLSKIQLIGFDMDYTLATYKKEAMEQLQYDLTLKRLVTHYHYPQEILGLIYHPQLVIRGLVVDKNLGHLFKNDVHGHVWRALHGTKELSQREIEVTYANQRIKVGTSRYTSLDTLFAMPEACLFCNLVDFFEARYQQGHSLAPLEIPSHNPHHTRAVFDTHKLFQDIRSAIDAIHSDDSLKAIIARNLPTYVHSDPDLAITLHKYRSTGKKLFLLTNSYWPYTKVIMSYLLEGHLKEYLSWQTFFDIIIVGGQKPGFFTSQNPFYKLNIEDDGSFTKNLSKETYFERNAVYEGGNIKEFEQRAQCAGEEILYVGDHIYGDIVRSKKESLWRTCLIIEELHDEINSWIKWSMEIENLVKFENKRQQLDAAINHHRMLHAHIETSLNDATHQTLTHSQLEELQHLSKTIRFEIDQGKRYLRELDLQQTHQLEQLERKFHPIWGKLLTEHNERSRFGQQVTSYACIYTGQVTNLLQYSPQHFFKAPTVTMSHEEILFNGLKKSHHSFTNRP